MHADGDGLYLVVKASGAKSWSFVFFWNGKRSEMGLGRVVDVPLGRARELVAIARAQLRDGINPIVARKAAQAAAERDAAIHTFGIEAEAYIDVHGAGFRNEKHKWQWRATLSIERGDDGKFKDTGFCLSLRDLPIADVDTKAVLEVLQPIWHTKQETASRVRGRIERVLDAAKVKGLRDGENPARWRGHLSTLLPKRQKLAARGHQRAMPYADVPAFVARLHGSKAMAALALEWTILAAARTGETVGGKLTELDRKARVWTVPADRIKAGREHRVPLTDRMMEILALADTARDEGNPHIFAGPGQHRPLSNMAMMQLMKRMAVDATVHGFRSAFRDWAGDETDFAREVAEAALAHVVGDETERAYRRGDALERRRKLMTAWSEYLHHR